MNLSGDFSINSNHSFMKMTNLSNMHNPDPFVYYNATQLIEANGYAAETHHVETKDGFILTLHRIPNNNTECVVLLQHGLLCDSTNWITNLRNQSLAFLFADKQCDIWLPNIRLVHQ